MIKPTSITARKIFFFMIFGDSEIKINGKMKGGQECPPYNYPINNPPLTFSTCPVM